MEVFNPTRRGDDGMTHMFGKRISKTSKTIRLIGELDSLQSMFGELYSLVPRNGCLGELLLLHNEKNRYFRSDIEYIISALYQINNLFWNPRESNFDIESLDDMLKVYTFKPLTKFQLPIYSNPLIAKINLLRAETRKIEISVLDLKNNSDEIGEFSKKQVKLLDKLAVWLNRLSSLLYAMMNHMNTDPPRLN